MGLDTVTLPGCHLSAAPDFALVGKFPRLLANYMMMLRIGKCAQRPFAGFDREALNPTVSASSELCILIALCYRMDFAGNRPGNRLELLGAHHDGLSCSTLEGFVLVQSGESPVLMYVICIQMGLFLWM